MVRGKLDNASIGVEASNQAHEDGAFLYLGMLNFGSQFSLRQEALQTAVVKAQIHDQTVILVADHGGLYHDVHWYLPLVETLVDQLGVDGQL